MALVSGSRYARLNGYLGAKPSSTTSNPTRDRASPHPNGSRGSEPPVALAVTKTQKRPEKPTLTPEKTSELLGFFLLALALLLGCAMATYHPMDPSVFHKTASTVRPKNLIGPLGAEAAAFGFQFLGISCLLIPFFFLA